MSYLEINNNFRGISKERKEVSSFMSNNIFTDYLRVKKRTHLNNLIVESGGIDVTGDSEFHDDLKIEGNLEVDGTLTVNNNILQYGYTLLPKFCVIMWSGAVVSIPTGWLLCDGTSHTVNGVNVTSPDLRGRFILSYGQGPLNFTNTTIGATGGEQNVTLSTTQIPSHTHTGTTSSNGDHTHTHNADGGQGNYGLALANGLNTVTDADSSSGELNVWTLPAALNIDNSGSHSHTFTTNSTGGGDSHNNMPPYYVLCFIMKGF